MSQSEPSFLESLRIASPCQASWAEMKGDDRVRFCGSCQKHVYDMRHLSRVEAEELVRSRESVCIRMTRRADGTVITSDCPVGARDKSRRQRVAGAAFGTLLAAGALLSKIRGSAEASHLEDGGLAAPFLAAVAKHAQHLAPEPEPVVMGDVSPVEPTPRPMMGAIARPDPTPPIPTVK